MSFAIGATLAFFYLESPWRYIVIAVLAAWEGFEIFLFLRWRKVRAYTGVEALVGAKGRATTTCRPDGQVRVKGQIWQAHCPAGVDKGQDVVIESVNGLKLLVAAARPGNSEQVS